MTLTFASSRAQVMNTVCRTLIWMGVPMYPLGDRPPGHMVAK